MTNTQSAENFIQNKQNAAPLKMRFLGLLHRYRQWMMDLELSPGSPEADALKSYELLPFEKQLSICEHLDITLEHLDEMEKEVSPYVTVGSKQKLPRELELRSLQKMLSRRRLRFADSSAEDFIDDGDLFEVYDAQGVQLYRSWSCYELCYYNLVDLQVYNWDELYIRPSWVVSKLYEKAPLLFTPGAKTMPYELPEYLLTERRQKSNRSLLFKMKFASPLLDEDSGAPIAFLSTGRMTRVPELNPNQSLSFL